MKDFPLVSVIIPTYKSGKTLKKAINSVLNQTYSNLEIIVVDDNNPNTKYRENAESIIMEYSHTNKLIYVQHEKNKNGAAARNTGFINSKGDFICFLDDDDTFSVTKIEKQVNYLMEKEDFGAVYCWRYQNNEVVSYDKTGDLSEELLSLSFAPFTSSIMLRRECYEVINGFDESYKRHQDYEFLLRFFEFYTIGVVEEPLIEIRGNQVDNALRGKELENLKRQFLNQFINHIDRIETRQRGFKKLVYARHYSTVFWSYFKLQQYISAFKILFKYSYKCGFTFWLSLLNYLKAYLNVKRKRL